jgi:hypothetical protein
MNDLRLLRDLHAGLPPASPDRLARGREHLLAAVRDGDRSRTTRTRRRLVAGGLATAGVAGGLAAALIVAPAARVGHHPAITVAGAAAVFTHAANAAANQPDLRPRPDQFVYVESVSRQAPQPVSDGLPDQPGSAVHRRAWLSADGRHAGLAHNSGEEPVWLCDHDAQKPPKGGDAGLKRITVDLAKPPTGCTPAPPAYDRSLPTDPAAALTWLYRHSQGGNPPDVQAFRTVGDTVRESYVPPAAMAAIFKAAARIPGVKVIGTVVDLAGRKGIAVGQTYGGARDELIFDRATYRLLGERTIVDHDTSFQPPGGKAAVKPTVGPSLADGKDGTVLYSAAVLRVAVTDRAGQPPAK